jgi:hypothetical protein
MTNPIILSEAQEAARQAYIQAQKNASNALLPVLSDARTTLNGIFTEQSINDLKAVSASLPQDSGLVQALQSLQLAIENCKRVAGFEYSRHLNIIQD